MRGRRASTFWVAVSLVILSACAVETPRNGFTLGGPQQGNNGGLAPGAPGAPTTGGLATTGPLAGGTQAPGGTGGGSAGGGGSQGGGGSSGGGGSTSAVGVTPTTITISIIGSFSGVYGPPTNVAYRGMETWIEDINRRGGIYGRKVIVKKVSNENSPEGGIAACKTVQSNGSFLAISSGSTYYTAYDCLDKAGFTTVYSAGLRSLSGGWKHSYESATAWDEAGRALPSLIRKQGDGGQKIGVLYIHDTAALEGAAKAFVAQAKADGMNCCVVESAEPNAQSFTPQLLRLQKAQVKVMALSSLLESVGILRDAQAINFKPQWTSMYGLTLDIVSSVARDSAAGAYGVRPYAAVDSPSFAAFEAKATQYGKAGALPAERFLFYANGLVLERVLLEAGPKPTKGSLIAGIESIKNFSTGAFPTLTWAPGRYYATNAVFPVICCRTSDWTWQGLGPPDDRF